MCGIFAVVSQENNAGKVIFNGLKRLEYRGYDSWGIALVSQGKIWLNKQTGIISQAKIVFPKSMIGIGHTRWATHGAVTKINAHPHYSKDKKFVLAQNGIVENFDILKKKLQQKGYIFKTQTDTEVIVRLIEDKLKKTNSLVKAVKAAFLELKGRNTIILLSYDGQIIAVRNGSPLVVGFDQNNYYFSSDVLSFASNANQVLIVDNNQLVIYDKDRLKLVDLKDLKNVVIKWEKIKIKDNKINTGGFPHFMLKEIYDSPYALRQFLSQDKNKYQVLATAIKKAENVYTIGSGTTGMAAAQIAYFLRKIAKVPAINLVGAEAQDYFSLFSDKDIIIVPSQSGETADVLEVLEIAKQKGVKIVSCVNMPGSTMTRLSDLKFMVQAGPEVCVVSTKVFTCHISWGYLMAKTVVNQYSKGIEDLSNLIIVIEEYLNNRKNHQQLKKIAKWLANKKDIFLLSKGQNLQIANEGMIKIIETSYLHAHAIPAGDLKHYAITIIEKGVPVVFIIANDEVRNDILNAIGEVKARGAEIIAIGPEKLEEFDFYLPMPDINKTSSILNIIPLQLLAYYMAVTLGNSVDKPRNIAKSVTVK